MTATLTARPALPARGVERIRARLVTPMPSDTLLGWLLPLAITGLAAFLRLSRLSTPRGLMFDEVYYAHDSYNLLRHGVELDNHDKQYGFVVHPPLGKWAMALSQGVFGHNAFGWRFASVVAGSLAVLVLARTARRMFRSTLLGCVAGLLLTLDGLEFVQSRIGMLDVFLMFWVVAAFACLVADRDDGRRRLAARLAPGAVDGGRFGPWLGVRWWRIGAGVCLGAAGATKWTGAFLLVGFGLLALAWDVGARRTAGVRSVWRGTLLRDTLPSALPLLVLPVVVYVASWLGWFLGDGKTAYDHDLYLHGQGTVGHFFAVLHGWWTYHQQIYGFHAHLDAGHPYRSGPWGWLLLARPILYYYESPRGCGAAQCSQTVLAVGTPALWWASIPALVASGWGWLTRRDWRAGGLLAGFAWSYLPWFYEDAHHRTMFLFYALPAVPFMVLAVTWCAGRVLGGLRVSETRQRWGAALVGGYLVLVAVNFFYLYPILSAKTITYDQWRTRMWFSNCADHNTKHERAPCWI